MATFVKGQMQDFVATKEFALNWDDRKIPSVKVRIGDIVKYDGEMAICKKKTGEEVTGRCPSLKSAINTMKWLVEKEFAPENPALTTPSLFEEKKTPAPDFDALRGGNFDTYVAQGFEVVPNKKVTKVIKEEELIVKHTAPVKTEEKKINKKHEVVGDQVEVKDRIIVSSSTSVKTKQPRNKPEIIKADEMGADSTIPIKGVNKIATGTKKKNSYIVDEKTPRTISEDMTKKEIDRMTKTVVKDEDQDGRVIKKIDTTKIKVQEVEGITLKKIESPKEMTFKKETKPVTEEIKVTVSSGGNVSAETEGVVVKTTEDKIKKAKERADARKKASMQTQKQIEQEKMISDEEIIPWEEAKKELHEPSIGTKGIVPDEIIPKEIISTEIAVKENSEIPNYLSMLPDDWGKRHWVQKEKFIMELTDKAFILFIQSVESIKAVQNACVERLAQLEQGKNS